MQSQAFPAETVDDTASVIKTIRAFMRKENPEANSGGGVTFYTPAEWKARGEQYGLNSVLVIAHDGGDMAAYCDYAQARFGSVERFARHLESHGYFIESCTCWYSAVYKIVS